MYALRKERKWMELVGLKVRNRENQYREGYARSLETKRVEWDGWRK